MVDGSTSEDGARRLLAGIEDGDPMILDALPCSPLSGEWAGSILPADVLSWYSLDAKSEGAEDVRLAFEDGFSRGVVDEVVRSATALLA